MENHSLILGPMNVMLSIHTTYYTKHCKFVIIAAVERLKKPTKGFFVFVGEKRSPLAQDNGYSWIGCQISGIPRLAMKPLWEALEKVGVDPKYPMFLNLWNDDGSQNEMNRALIKEMEEDGEIIIGMGRIVQTELQKLGIPHRKMVHPAARGLIRRTSLFRQHVEKVLFSSSR